MLLGWPALTGAFAKARYLASVRFASAARVRGEPERAVHALRRSPAPGWK